MELCLSLRESYKCATVFNPLFRNHSTRDIELLLNPSLSSKRARSRSRGSSLTSGSRILIAADTVCDGVRRSLLQCRSFMPTLKLDPNSDQSTTPCFASHRILISSSSFNNQHSSTVSLSHNSTTLRQPGTTTPSHLLSGSRN